MCVIVCVCGGGGGARLGGGVDVCVCTGVENLPVISQNKDCEEINLCENSEGLELSCLIRVFAIRLVIAKKIAQCKIPDQDALIRWLIVICGNVQRSLKASRGLFVQRKQKHR